MPQILTNLVAIVFFRTPARTETPSDIKPTKSKLPTLDTATDASTNLTPSYRPRYLLFNGLHLLLSGALLATITILVYSFNNHPPPRFDSGITLNTLIAWLSAVSQLFLLIPLADSISKAKWALFHRQRRRLDELDHIDAASRNPLGAVRWLLKFRTGRWVNLGAALVVLSLGFAPGIQHLLRYDLLSAEDPTQPATLAVNTDYAPVRGLDRGLVFATPQAVLWGAYSAVLGQAVQPAFSCPSGNCTFPAAATVGLCSRCTETTSQLQSTCKDLSAKTPFCISASVCYTSGKLCTYRDAATNATVGGGSTFLQVIADGVSFSNSSQGNIEIPRELVNLTAVFIQPNVEADLPDTGGAAAGDTRLPLAPGHVPASAKEPVARAYTCAISYCEQRLRASVASGQLREVATVADDSVDSFIIPTPQLGQITDTLFDRRVNLTRSAGSSSTVSLAAVFALSQGFSAALTGNASVPDTVVAAPGAAAADFHRGWYQALLSESFPDIVASVAASTTAAIRNSASAPPLAGATWVRKLLLRAEWRWLALPALLLFATLALLLAVSASAKREHAPWLGTSQLAPVLVDLERAVRGEMEVADAGWGDRGLMREAARGVKVRIAPVHALDGRARLEFTRLPSPA